MGGGPKSCDNNPGRSQEQKSLFVLLFPVGCLAAPAFAQKITIDDAKEFDLGQVKTFAYNPTDDTKENRPDRTHEPGLDFLHADIPPWHSLRVSIGMGAGGGSRTRSLPVN